MELFEEVKVTRIPEDIPDEAVQGAIDDIIEDECYALDIDELVIVRIDDKGTYATIPIFKPLPDSPITWGTDIFPSHPKPRYPEPNNPVIFPNGVKVTRIHKGIPDKAVQGCINLVEKENPGLELAELIIACKEKEGQYGIIPIFKPLPKSDQ